MEYPRQQGRRRGQPNRQCSVYVNDVRIRGVGTIDVVIDFMLREPESVRLVTRMPVAIPTALELASDLQHALDQLTKREREESRLAN